MIVAVFGSRKGVELRRVTQWVAKLSEKHPSAIVASGGAPGVDRQAELAGQHYGLRVVSFRPEQWVRWQNRKQPLAPVRWEDENNPTASELRDHERFKRAQAEFQALVREGLDSWVIAVYEFTPGEQARSYALDTRYDNFRHAALARNTKLAEIADHGAAFWDGASTGTAHTMSEFKRLGKESQLSVLS